MPAKGDTHWTEERIAALRRLIAEDKSDKQTARALGVSASSVWNMRHALQIKRAGLVARPIVQKDTVWARTPGMRDRLIELQKQGLGGSKITPILIKEFGVSITRNSVQGQINRAGLASPMPNRTVKLRKVVRLFATPKRKQTAQPLQNKEVCLKNKLRVSCSFIIDKVGLRYIVCDKPVPMNCNSYCQEHYNLCYISKKGTQQNVYAK